MIFGKANLETRAPFTAVAHLPGSFPSLINNIQFRAWCMDRFTLVIGLAANPTVTCWASILKSIAYPGTAGRSLTTVPIIRIAGATFGRWLTVSIIILFVWRDWRELYTKVFLLLLVRRSRLLILLLIF